MKMLKLAYTPFKGLKEVLETKHFALRKQDIVEHRTDEEIFREAMSDVREITEFRKILPGQPPNIVPLPSQKDDSLDVLSDIVKGKTKIRLSDTAEYIEWVSPRIRKDIAEKLHRGEFSVQDSIDLHGMTLVEAEESLSCFFRRAIQKRLFCVKVIHGRGLRSPQGPVLKEALKKFLHRSFSKWTLAYATAKHSDGGLGATYIILKSK